MTSLDCLRYLVSAGLDPVERDDDVLPGEHLLQHLTARLLYGRVQVQVVVGDAQLVHDLRDLPPEEGRR